MFRSSPGRYEVWHIKDIAGLEELHAEPDQIERMMDVRIVPDGSR